MTDHPFKCLGCGGWPLDRAEDAYHCRSCEAAYPVRFGVPLFLNGLEIVPSDCRISPEVAAEICRLKDVAPDADKLQALREILSYNYRLPELHLTAENNYLLNRIPLPDHLKRSPVVADRSGTPVNREVRYRITGHLIPDALPCGRWVFRNVRLENTGTSIISSKGAAPVNLAYHWRTPSGRLVTFDGQRTRLPIDLLPGRSLSLPTLIRTPPSPGPHVLELMMVQEGGAWLPDQAYRVAVRIVPAAPCPLAVPAHWPEVPQAAVVGYDYARDHIEGRARLHEEVRRRRRPGMRLLEVGGCCDPMARGAGAEVYSADIDVQTLQLGQALVASPGERLHFIAADAYHLPFVDHSFDGAVIFSALHHFAHPDEVLAGLRRLLKPDGFLAVMCEPVGCYWGEDVPADLRRELEQGINEQVFSLEEYHYLFRRAGLDVTWLALDGCSLKAILRAAPDGAVVPGRAPCVGAPPLTRARVWGDFWARMWSDFRRHCRRSA